LRFPDCLGPLGVSAYRTFPLFLDAGHLATFFSIAIWTVWAAPLFGCTGQERDKQWAVVILCYFIGWNVLGVLLMGLNWLGG
jgi:hypothetical protein